MADRGLIVSVSGPSGVGKGTVLKRVSEMIEQKWPGRATYSISATTRSPRPGETDGVEYHFRTKEEFEKMIETGEILEYDQYVGNYYGTPAAPLAETVGQGKIILCDITIEGSLAIEKKFGDDSVIIMLLPPSYAELEARLKGRGTEDDAKVQARLAKAREEVARAGEFEYAVQNNEVEQAAADIMKIIESEMLKTIRQTQAIKNLE
jgi:guanylate kinase